LTWQIILILIGTGIILASYLVLFILLAKSKKSLAKAVADVVRMRGAWQESQDIIQRVKFLQDAEELSDESARSEVLDLIDGWDPVDPNGASDPFKC